jgi:hypothetical protein
MTREDTEKYGYEDPDEVARQRNPHLRSYGGSTGGQVRRSSMKQQGAPRRRASINLVGTVEVHLPGRSKPVLRRTSVEFRDVKRPEQESPRTSTVSDEAESGHWMTSEEYEKIAHDNLKIVRAIEKGTEKQFCTRGLEDRLGHAGNTERSRLEAKQAVWDEQRRQQEAGIYDEVRIMENYRMATVQSKLAAIDRADGDRAEVEKYVKKVRQPRRRRMSCC